MSARAGEPAEKTGDFYCASCSERVRVSKVTRSRSAGTATASSIAAETRAERSVYIGRVSALQRVDRATAGPGSGLILVGVVVTHGGARTPGPIDCAKLIDCPQVKRLAHQVARYDQPMPCRLHSRTSPPR
jgi:hypothetical protein